VAANVKREIGEKEIAVGSTILNKVQNVGAISSKGSVDFGADATSDQELEIVFDIS
jgi:hypothetical protein